MSLEIERAEVEGVWKIVKIHKIHSLEISIGFSFGLISGVEKWRWINGRSLFAGETFERKWGETKSRVVAGLRMNIYVRRHDAPFGATFDNASDTEIVITVHDWRFNENIGDRGIESGNNFSIIVRIVSLNDTTRNFTRSLLYRRSISYKDFALFEIVWNYMYVCVRISRRYIGRKIDLTQSVLSWIHLKVNQTDTLSLVHRFCIYVSSIWAPVR